MPSPRETTIPATRRSRQSIGAHTDVRKAMDKENATVEAGGSLAANRKKSRSKSMGPGGLDALKQGSGNRRASLAAPPKPPRSILKPAIPGIPDIPPLKKKREAEPSPRNSNSTGGDDSSGSKVALRTEEEQQAAAREREERERRDARRKSLANRRVSFAAEATLHTFHEVDYNQDSTASTESSRRASSAAGTPAPGGREATPQDQLQHPPQSPDNQRDLHQKNRRRSSGAQPANFPSQEDDTATSIIYSSDSEPADAVEEIVDDGDEASSSDSDDGTMMSIETEEVTGTSVASDRSAPSGDESSTLDEALRLAAQRAGNQGREDDDSEDDDGEEVIPSFGWVKKGDQQSPEDQTQQDSVAHSHQSRPSQDEEGTETDMDMDVTSSMGGILRSGDSQQPDEAEDMSMEVTTAFGGILPQNKSHDGAQVDQENAPANEATMELTTALGGIRHAQDDEFDENEDMSMELTTAMGNVLAQQKPNGAGAPRRRTSGRKSEAGEDDATMDMTVGLGKIIPGSGESQNDESEGDATMGMDMTTAMGGIVGKGAASPRTLGKRIMEQEADKPNSPKKAIIAAVTQGSPQKRTLPQRPASMGRQSSSPGLSAFRGQGLRRSTGPPSSEASRGDTKAKTPSPPKPSTPQRTPVSAKKTGLRSQSRTPQSASPKRQPAAQGSSRTPSPEKPVQGRASFFQSDPKTGDRTPTVVLTPQPRRLSGVGADRNGLGSPRVAEVFERRGSLGDAATEFVPGKRVVSFQDPQTMSEEVEKERREEEDKENSRSILEREADGSQEDNEATLNLREMIDSLSPKRNPLKGRKSLHVGSAQGILGKRPAELDEDDEEEENDGVKRLKGHQGSPVKNVRLQQPPSKAETTGRQTKSFGGALHQAGTNLTPSLSSPLKKDPATTPRHQGRFKDVNDSKTVHEVNFHDSPAKDEGQVMEEVNDDQIHLQDFLNMTSIRFMELTTTKRRHTTAPGTLNDGSAADGQDDMSLERCVVAGACTVPMLELYQHSCRELKKYISEGRRMVKEIETDTFEENPPLFREYMSATPDVKTLMDNQFKNVKTHARLLSKAMWYEWRMKLQDGLKEGLVKISEEMGDDEKHLQEQRDLLNSVLPAGIAEYEALEEEGNNLEEAAKELADSDPDQLEAARSELATLDEDIDAKKKLIADLRQQFEASGTEVDGLVTQKEQCLADIRESEKIREECRGWTSAEVNALKDRVDAIEEQHGWAVTGLSGTTLSMTYKREIELVFDTASFQPHQPNSRIDLWYIADGRENKPIPKTAEKEFFLQSIRDYIRALPQGRTKVAQLLQVVRTAWDKAALVSSHISRINITFPTTVERTSDSSVAMTSSLLLVPLETRVEITLRLSERNGPSGVDVAIAADAKIVYGEHFNVAKIGEFLVTRIGERVGASEEGWSDVIVELHERLIARGKK